jgi:hypothetical protein
MAVIGYSDNPSSIYVYEMMAKWVAHLLDGAFRLPGVARMERSVAEWGEYVKEARRRRRRGPVHQRRQYLVQRRALSGHGLQSAEEEGDPGRVAATLRTS